jgi:uncharacterized protein
MERFLPPAQAQALAFSASYVAVLVLMAVFLGLRVALMRKAERISLGDGANSALNRRIRAHGNFSEYAPLLIGVLIVLPLVGAREWLVHLVGATGLTGRILHAIAVTTGDSLLRYRALGMVMTLAALIIGALALLVLAWR